MNLLKIKIIFSKITLILELKNKFYSLILIFLNYIFYLKTKIQRIKNTKKNINLLNKEIVDVIIPVFNAKEYINKCLETIFISKSNYFINLLIINDCSDQETKEVLNKYRSKFYSKALYKIKCDNLTKNEIVNKVIKFYEPD